MLRFNLLVVLCLGVLVSCGRTDPEGPASAVSPGRKLTALTTSTTITVPRLKWSGSSGTCLNCRTDTGSKYACSSGTGWDNGQRTFNDPVPAGGRVIGIEALVYGRLANVGGGSTSTLTVKLNTQDLVGVNGAATMTELACSTVTSPTSTDCDPDKKFNYSNVSGIAAYVYKSATAPGTNTIDLDLPSSGSPNYCVSHVDVILTVELPRIAVLTDTVDFGNQKVGTSSQARVVRVTNDGAVPLTITELSATPSFNVTLTPSQTLPITIAVGGHRDLSVTFTPIDPVKITDGAITITSNASNATAGSTTVRLLGTGVSLATDVSPRALPSFGDQRINTSSAAQQVKVRNAGSTPLEIDTITAAAPFVLDPSPSLPFTLQPGAEETVSVKFHPTLESDESETTVTGLLTITPDAATGESSVTVDLVGGKGVKPDLVLTPEPPSALEFGSL